MKTPSLSTHTDRNSILLSMSRYGLRCLEFPMDTSWLNFSVSFSTLALFRGRGMISFLGVEFLFMPGTPGVLSLSFLVPGGFAAGAAGKSTLPYTLAPYWGIIIAIRAETSVSRKQNFHIAIKSALICHEVWVVNILPNVLNFKTLGYQRHTHMKSGQLLKIKVPRVRKALVDCIQCPRIIQLSWTEQHKMFLSQKFR